MSKPEASEWTERDLLFATTEMLHCIAAWLVMSGIATPEKLKGLVTIAGQRLEKNDQPAAANALRATFSGALSGEWANMRTLIDPKKTGGSV